MNKRGTKGKEKEYRKVQMSQYLLPSTQLKIQDQKKIFEIRNRMTNSLEDFYKQSPNEIKSIYGEQESMKHMYYCKALNNIELKVDYENMCQGEIKKI